jgi:rhodanese-related sulfurtransferase
MFNFFKKLFQTNYTSLSGYDFKSTFKNDPNAVLVDVRSQGEFKQGSIKGAKNMPINDASFAQKVSALDKDKTYFVFCAAGARSAAACNRMAAAGLTVYNLRGGIGQWPKA